MALLPARRRFAQGELISGTRYRVIRQLGAGGMSAVYEVEHAELKRRFVLKALWSDLAKRKDLVERARKEWRALGKLRHPNIVAVTDAGLTECGLPYVVMEYLPGETLGARLRRGERLSVPEVLEIACDLLAALSAAHAIGIVHRDIKPENVLLPESGPLKLLDFGIAKLADEHAKYVTNSGVALGTPRYMAPEQALGERVDCRADLYCVGLMLFEMVSGKRVFPEAKSVDDVLAAQLDEVPLPLAQVVPGVAPELSRLVSALLDKNPSRRPASAEAVIEAMAPLRERYSRQVSTSQVTALARYLAPTVEHRRRAPRLSVTHSARAPSDGSPSSGGRAPAGTPKTAESPRGRFIPRRLMAAVALALAVVGSAPWWAGDFAPSVQAAGVAEPPMPDRAVAARANVSRPRSVEGEARASEPVECAHENTPPRRREPHDPRQVPRSSPASPPPELPCGASGAARAVPFASGFLRDDGPGQGSPMPLSGL